MQHLESHLIIRLWLARFRGTDQSVYGSSAEGSPSYSRPGLSDPDRWIWVRRAAHDNIHTTNSSTVPITSTRSASCVRRSPDHQITKVAKACLGIYKEALV